MCTDNHPPSFLLVNTNKSTTLAASTSIYSSSYELVRPCVLVSDHIFTALIISPFFKHQLSVLNYPITLMYLSLNNNFIFFSSTTFKFQQQNTTQKFARIQRWTTKHTQHPSSSSPRVQFSDSFRAATGKSSPGLASYNSGLRVPYLPLQYH